MKSKLLLIYVALLVISCSKNKTISITNPLDVQRIDELIVLKYSELTERFDIPDNMVPAFKSGSEYIPSQVDDLDNNGTWDEVAFLLDFKPGQTIQVEVVFLDPEDYPEFEKRTNLRLGILQNDGSYKEVDRYFAPRCDDGFEIIAQGESVCWENDKMAFRVYFDCRNVKDLYGKLKPGMIIDKIGTPEMGDYHSLADWGMDVLHCGSSLGSGGIALMRNDSLYRLGSTKNYEYVKRVEGPVRSVFDLVYDGWAVGDDSIAAIEHISIYPGKYWFKSEKSVSGVQKDDQIVTGIVTSRLEKEPFEFEASDYKCIGTHDVQSLNDDELGMAVLVPSNKAGKVGRTSDINYFNQGYQTVPEKSFSHIISETCYIGQKIISQTEPSAHYFFSVWGLEKEQWKTEKGFKEYIKKEAKKLSTPVIIQ